MRRKASVAGLEISAPTMAGAPVDALVSPPPPASRLSLSLPLSPSQRPPAASPSTPTVSSSSSPRATDTAAAVDRAVASLLLSPTGSSRIALAESLRKPSLLNCDTMQGYMVVHAKKPKKKLFTLHRSYFVVADAAKPVLEVFTNESRSERVYLFSLAGANVDFETDLVSHAVRAKCFCLNVQSWRKRGVDYLRPQGFVFYQENQTQMMGWVKCIHVAIRKASARTDCDHRTRYSESSTVSSEAPFGYDSDAADSERAAETELESERETTTMATAAETAVGTTTQSPMPTSMKSPTAAVPASRSPRRMRAPSRRRGGVEPLHCGGATNPQAAGGKASHFPRLNTMLATMKSTSHPQQHPMADDEKSGSGCGQPAATPAARSGKPSSPFSPSLISNLHMPRGKSSSTRHVTAVAPPPAASKRLSDPFQQQQSRKKDDALFHGFPPFFSPRGPRSAPKQAATAKERARASEDEPKAPSSVQSHHDDRDIDWTTVDSPSEASPDHTPESRLSNHLARLAFLLASCIGGICQLSVFLPVAIAGVFVYANDRHADEFASAAVAACWVYAAGCVQSSLALCSIAAILYGWSYADFRTRQRLRRRRIAERMLHGESDNFAHIQFPNWVVRPDSDRVDWLNKVLLTGWPYMKIAIRNSLMDSVNPLLESTRPAFMSSLSLVRVDLGNRVPVISGVKFVSANAKTEEVTIDVDVRVISDESLVAELRMASNLGAAAIVSLRDLFLAGTLRVTLNPLSVYWPCFSALSVSFTDRPMLDFSLTAAKINISNVPFASEWLQTFLHDLLLDYFVWPKVAHIPLWDETSTSAVSATL